jgi:hypothetical protein
VFHGYFSKEDGQGKSLTALPMLMLYIRETQAKLTSPVSMATMRKSKNLTRIGEDVEKLETLYTFGGNEK